MTINVVNMILKCIKLTLISIIFSLTAVAGDLDSPSDPNTLSSGMYSLDDIYNRLNSGTAGTITSFNEPAQAPVSQGRNLNDIMSIAPTVDNQFGATPADVAFGKKFWGLKDGTWGLQTGTRITKSSCVPPAYVFNSPSDPNNVDGTGTRWCIPGDGTVIDLFSGLVWLRDMGALGTLPWTGCQTSSCTIAGTTNKTAVGVLGELSNGFPLNINSMATTLSDGSVSGDWRAPTVVELEAFKVSLSSESLNPFSNLNGTGSTINAWTSSYTPNIAGSIQGLSSQYYLSAFTIRNTIDSSSVHTAAFNVIAVRSRKDTQ